MLSTSHEYIVPTTTSLLDTSSLRSRYKKNNPERLALITFIEQFCKFAKESLSDKLAKQVLSDLMMGAWIYCLEKIAIKYHWLNPERSTLYNIFSNKLESPLNRLDKKDKLSYLNKFHKYFFRVGGHPEQIAKFENHFKNENLNELNANIVCIINYIFRQISPFEQILNSIPYEEVLDERMVKLFENYIKLAETDNPQRKFLAQLVVAMSTVPVDSEQDDKHFLTRSMRIKVGILLYIIKMIYDSYKIRAAIGNSVLHDLCCQILNIKHIEDIDPISRHACLSACENYLNCESNIVKIERFIRKYFKKEEIVIPNIDAEIREHRKNMSAMIDKLSAKHSPLFSKSTAAAVVLGALIGAAPGYGLGFFMAKMIDITDYASALKTAMSETTSHGMTLVLGPSVKNLGYYSSNIIVDASTDYLLSTLMQWLSMGICGLSSGLVKIVIVDYTAKTLVNIGKLILHLDKNTPHRFLSKEDKIYLEFITDLPDELISKLQKDQIKNLITNPNELVANTNEHGFFNNTNKILPKSKNDDLQGRSLCVAIKN